MKRLFPLALLFCACFTPGPNTDTTTQELNAEGEGSPRDLPTAADEPSPDPAPEARTVRASTASCTPAPKSLVWPVAGGENRTWILGAYFDHRREAGKVLDYRQAADDRSKAYDHHYGTDICIANMRKMDQGVTVSAVAPGKVISVVESNPDRNTEGKPYNIVRIEHAGGWRSEYVHLRQNSVRVAVGQQVRAGDPIAQVGASGLQNGPHPHLHLWVRDCDGTLHDPFAESLWQAPAQYDPTLGLLDYAVKRGAFDLDTFYDPPANATQIAPGETVGIAGYWAVGRPGDVAKVVIRRADASVFLQGQYVIKDLANWSWSQGYRYWNRVVDSVAPGTWTVTWYANDVLKAEHRFTVR